jgi:hypothetical protein
MRAFEARSRQRMLSVHMIRRLVAPVSSFRATLAFSIVIKLLCRFLIATTQLLLQFAPLNLAHPLANAAWPIAEPGDSHIAGREELDLAGPV